MPAVRNVLVKNTYKDSIQLMRISENARKQTGVIDAAVVMGTPTNKELLDNVGLLTEEGRGSSSEDILIALKIESESEAVEKVNAIKSELERPSPREKQESYFSNIESALRTMPDANFAIVSVPGPYVRAVTSELLERGIDTQIFSDHVDVEDEIYLKRLASSKGLLVLGPGAGTSLVAGKAIAFSNVVNRGRIGIVAAAGTGMQELSVLISRAGFGISEGLGVGGRDVKSGVGGLMTLASIRALEEDEDTEAVCFVSKPPSGDVLSKIIGYIREETKKQYVLAFFGPETDSIIRATPPHPRICFAHSLHAAAIRSIEQLGSTQRNITSNNLPLAGMGKSELEALAFSIYSKLTPDQRWVRGLFAGGTLMSEAMQILTRLLGTVVYSNAPFDKEGKLEDSYVSKGNTLIDFGEEEFTSGRPHPMIDPTIRKIRLAHELRDPEVACILLDVILGYASHGDPAGAIVEVLQKQPGKPVPILAHVCGTNGDPQNASKQEKKLRDSGVVVLPSNASTAFLAGLIASRGRIDAQIKASAYADFLCLQ